MKQVLVTGGAGFIGSHLVDGLLADGWTVTTFDSFDPFYDVAIKERNVARHLLHPSYRLVRGDVRDAAMVVQSLPGPYDVIVHLAAKAGVRPSIEQPIAYQQVNIAGTQNLLELARQLAVPQFVFASSSSVYGVNENVPWRESDFVLKPISPYACTKVSGELLGHTYSHLYGMRFLALRFFTVYGPRQRPDLAIHKFAQRMLAGLPIPVYGDGSTRRDYTYVADIVSGVRAAIGYDGAAYDVINLGNHHTVTLNEMIAALERALGVRAVVEHLPLQPGDVPQTYASIDKARALLGYEPGTTFDEGTRRFADWLRRANRGEAAD